MPSHTLLPETAALAVAVPPQDINGGFAEDAVSLKNYSRCDVYIAAGNIASDVVVTLKQSTNVALADEKALPFAFVYKYPNVTQATKTAVVSDTFTITAANDDNTQWVIPIEASELDVSGGFDVLRLDLVDPGGVALISATYYLAGGRFKKTPMPDPLVN